MHHRAVPVLVVAVTLGLAAAGYLWWTGRAPVVDSVTATGMLEGTRVVVAAEVNARVVQVFVARGASVERGQPLVQLDDRDLRLRQRQAPANGPEQQTLALQLEKLQLRAPVDGIIAERAIEPGELAMPGAPLLLIERARDLRLVMYVSEGQIGRVQVGQGVTFTTDSLPSERFAGQVESIGASAEFTPRNVQAPKDRALLVFAVWARVTDDSGRLKPGMPVDAVINE
ncbi:MAG: efflux RND transporter periplasmic adaptor subunit [Chloroflexi bacterium]|nr:efflux RND transporter periplasmic adaptor subunit [Chloroflexota bacterium]